MKKVVWLLAVLIVAGCSSGVSEQDRELGNMIYDMYTDYYTSNMEYFGYDGRVDVDSYGRGDSYCGYDLLFDELSLIGYELVNDCLQADIILRSFGSSQDSIISIDQFGLDDYSNYHYSVVMIYYFDDPIDSDAFARNLALKTQELYDDMFDFSVHYDDPALFVRDRRYDIFDYYHYSVGAPLFLGLDDISGYSHLIIMEKGNTVLVHKAYAPETLLRIRL
ncbi:MAG: hypothetical protein ACMXYL_00470 [Candidatus Woesearchaeota archaeon]